MFYSYFDELCKQKGVSANKACKEMGISRSVAAKWKSTNTSPRYDTLIKISDYFGVSIDTLLEQSGQKENPATNSDRAEEDKLDYFYKMFNQLSHEEQEEFVTSVLKQLLRNQ